MLRELARFLRQHALVTTTAALAVAMLAAGKVTLAAARRSVDVDLLLVLFALLVAVEILRESGWLDNAVARALQQFRTERAFASMVVAAAAVLAMFITNDVALFVIVPFTVGASRISEVHLENLVALEVVAANLVGCLTPLGNPQNLFIFHQSGWSAPAFVIAMAPFVAACTAGLALAVIATSERVPLSVTPKPLPRIDRRAAAAGALTFALVLLEIARVVSGWPAAIASAVAGAIFLRRRVDLSIVPLFFFAFIVVAGMRSFRLGFHATYWSAIAISQVISNVPATVLLAPFAQHDWKTLLYGANAGGCGTIIASLANLLGWRIYVRESGRDPRFFWRLTAISFAFLAWSGAAGWLLLRWQGR